MKSSTMDAIIIVYANCSQANNVGAIRGTFGIVSDIMNTGGDKNSSN